MYLQTKIWNWNQYPDIDMFCYRHDLGQPKCFKIKSPTAFFRHKLMDQILNEQQIKKQQLQQFNQIINIDKTKNGFVIVNVEQQYVPLKTQYLYAVCHQQKLPIQDGNQIKIGKTHLIVQHISKLKNLSRQEEFFVQNQINLNFRLGEIGENFYDDSTMASDIPEAPSCRYCFLKSISSQNPLVCPCNCSGETKYVHKKCLVEWILMKSKYTVNQQQGIYKYKSQLKCQICKRQFNLMEFLPCLNPSAIPNEYIIFSVVEQNQSMTYLVNLEITKVINIGRKLDNHVIIEQSSVSRFHCCLIYNQKDKNVYIEDYASKFGTLVKKKIIKVNSQNQTIILQRGHTKFEFTLRFKQGLPQKMRKIGVFGKPKSK